MPLFRRSKPESASSAQPAETREQTLLRRAREYLRTLQTHYPSEYERVLSEVEQGDLARVKITLRSLGSIVDEGYIESMISEVQTRVSSARLSYQNALDENPDVLRILLRSGNRSEAIELYQHRTGVDWPEALAAIKDLERELAAEDAEGR
ncbi:hypothetical protein [Cohnella panacarvi]|uniref:hypothetical protein n=1 Tax=Cohnella panacarvi TaxID=400776 RepID=UPI00047A2758|nr:hypothetical protein [Cohnella panacarvi]